MITLQSDIDGSYDEDSNDDSKCHMADEKDVSYYYFDDKNFDMQNANKEMYGGLKDATKQYLEERKKVEVLQKEKDEMKKEKKQEKLIVEPMKQVAEFMKKSKQVV